MKKLQAYALLFLGALSCFTLGMYTVSTTTKTKVIEPHQWIITSLFGAMWFFLAVKKFKEIFTTPIELTYKERISWFFNNYYETGMEFDIMLSSWQQYDLDNFEWYGEIIKIPKYKHELK